MATKYLKFGEKIAAKYADEVIVLSKNVQKYFKDTYNRETKFIPNGVNIPTIREANIIKSKYGLEKNSYILFLARIVPEKGLDYLLEAFKDVSTDKKLVIAGESSHSNHYVEKIKKMASQDDRVIMTGFVQGEELDELFSNCYLYCLPSDIEGMPISLLEAMSYGCKCLVSDIQENVQVCEQYANSFRRGDSRDLKRQINHILESKDGDKNTGNISSCILSKYNWDEAVSAIMELYTGMGRS